MSVSFKVSFSAHTCIAKYKRFTLVKVFNYCVRTSLPSATLYMLAGEFHKSLMRHLGGIYSYAAVGCKKAKCNHICQHSGPHTGINW